MGLVLEKPSVYLLLFRLSNFGRGDLLPDKVISILGNPCSLFRFQLGLLALGSFIPPHVPLKVNNACFYFLVHMSNSPLTPLQVCLSVCLSSWVVREPALSILPI